MNIVRDKKNKFDIFITLWIIFGIIVILGFFVFSFIIGGSALNGYQQGERYFLCNHEEITQVSKMIWIISKAWHILFLIFIPLTPIGAFVISHIQNKIELRKNRFE